MAIKRLKFVRNSGNFAFYDIETEGTVDPSEITKELAQIVEDYDLTEQRNPKPGQEAGGLIEKLANAYTEDGKTVSGVVSQARGIKIQHSKLHDVISDIKSKGYQVVE